MYREFGLLSVSTSLIERRVQLEFTLDVDPDSATLDALVFCVKDSGRIVPMDIAVSKRTITLHLREWPQTETEYLLRIQSGSIRSIVDDELPDSLLRTLTFKSEVLSTIDILTPAHHEELTDLRVSWRENSVEESGEGLVFSYYLEIAEENAFYNIVRSTDVSEQQEIQLQGLKPGQYYLRIRAQKNKEYGRWSETVTFVMKEKEAVEPDEPIYERPLVLKTKPANGVTPASFIFVFDEDIDTDMVPTITLQRRPI